MVELVNEFIVDLINSHSFTDEAAVTVRNGSLSVVEGDCLVTHKRVYIELDVVGDDWGDKSNLTIGLSPLMALALVRRLIDCLDGSGLENLPPVHGRFTRHLLNALNGVEVDDDIILQINSINSQSSSSVDSGAQLEGILPPSIR